MSVILLIVGLVLFIALVVVHEWGHFIMARRNGVTVEEFAIFFPPRLFKRKTKAGWDFAINLLPLGGYVKLKGEHDSDTAKGSFGAASLAAKTKIMAAGVVMNLITAIVLFTILALVGIPQLVDNQFTIKSDTKVSRSELIISYVEPGSPAAKAGLKTGDQIKGAWLSRAGTCAYPEFVGSLHCDLGPLTGYGPKDPDITIKNPQDLKNVTKQHAGKVVQFAVVRGGKEYAPSVQLRTEQVVATSQKTNAPKGYLGVAPSTYTLQRSTWSAPIVALGLTKQFTVLTFQGLGKAVAGLGSIIAGAVTGNTHARQNGQTAASEQVSGPVGIYVILQDGSLLGYQYVLFIIAIISLTLAIMNILPIPALDGGRLWITLFTRAIGKPLSAKREEWINATGFLVLIGLMVVITVVDVKRFF
ncbi:MAG TPA: M50 family metallopeptidase [Candidatus Microsaccharimonas sp.]|nr:M50 family metallopeptidase [Candidatus Microsaccharimonas sp.]